MVGNYIEKAQKEFDNSQFRTVSTEINNSPNLIFVSVCTTLTVVLTYLHIVQNLET